MKAGSKWKAKYEEAKAGGRKAAGRIRERASKQEGMLAAAAVGGGAVHGALRAQGWTDIAGVDAGVVVGGGAVLAAQAMPQGTGRSLLLGIGAGVAAAAVSEMVEDRMTGGA